MAYDSNTLNNAGRRTSAWLASAAVPQVAFVDAVYKLAEDNYDRGGDTIVECFECEEIVEQFTHLNQVREFCGLRLEQASNARWGEDSDPEIDALERFKGWK